jgi:3-phenylpropionate/trans-cinnamate dioxygenase ferredoxin reductase component
MTPPGVVVVGGSAAGVAAAEAARRSGFDGPITVIGDEPHPPYTRPALSKALLRGTAGAESVHLPAPDAGIDFHPGRRATGLDTARRRVLLADGEALGYTGVVVATGARARTLRRGACGETVLRSLDDAIRLRDALRGARSALVIGSGFVGTEVASACVAAGVPTTVVTRHALLVPHLGPDLARLLTREATDAGVVLVRSHAEMRLVGGERVTGVVLPDGTALEADVVVTAVGCLPNVEWLRGSGLVHGGGVLVNERCRAAAGIVAAGDVARVRGPRPARTPFWTAALDQARVAGEALVRGEAAPRYVPAPFYWTEAFGLAVTIAGPIPAAGHRETLAGSLLDRSGLFRWRAPGGSTVAAVNHKIAVRKLRALAREGA